VFRQTADAALNSLGGRKPGDIPAGDLEKMTGTDLKGVVNNAVKQGEDEKSSLRIKIELDLDVEVHLTARVKGDITIGLL
jgi:hypothetical protein